MASVAAAVVACVVASVVACVVACVVASVVASVVGSVCAASSCHFWRKARTCSRICWSRAALMWPSLYWAVLSQQITARSSLLPSYFSVSATGRTSSQTSMLPLMGRPFSSLGGSGAISGMRMGDMFRSSVRRRTAASRSSFFFSTVRRLRSSSSSDRVVSKHIRTSPFFTLSPSCTRISVTIWVSERKTV